MAGTLTISTLSDGTNSTSSTNCIQGSAKAWVNFDGTGTVAIRSSFNVSSITDNGTGLYTVNFTNAMPNANYSVVARAKGAAGIVEGGLSNSTYSTGSVQCATYNTGTGANTDAPYVNVAIFSL